MALRQTTSPRDRVEVHSVDWTAKSRTELATIHWGGGVNFFAGLWIMVSPVILHFSQANPLLTVSNVIFGLIVSLFALVRATGAYGTSQLSWLSAAMGAWMVLSGVVYAAAMRGALWSNVIAGLIIFVLALTSAIATDRAAS